MIQKFLCVLQTQAIKSQPTALQIPFIPLPLTLMWFSLDHLAWDGGWVRWHYKCLFIKLSLQVILLGSFVFLLNLSMFSHHTFSETRQTSLFYVVSAEETLNDFVSFCWINSKQFHLDTFTVKPHVDLDRLLHPILPASHTWHTNSLSCLLKSAILYLLFCSATAAAPLFICKHFLLPTLLQPHLHPPVGSASPPTSGALNVGILFLQNLEYFGAVQIKCRWAACGLWAVQWVTRSYKLCQRLVCQMCGERVAWAVCQR